jgi:hypothetical protein
MMHPLKNERLCANDNCIEGCKLKECPNGMVYRNESHIDCVPKSICKPICLQHNGITYYEGDIISMDACHTCKCTRGAKICTGTSCITETPHVDDFFVCETGWTSWINQDSFDNLQQQQQKQPIKAAQSNYFKEDDIEPLPTSLQFVSKFLLIDNNSKMIYRK